MKSYTSYLLSGLLLVAYLISVTGIGVYNCHCEHANQLALFSTGNCECKSEHTHPAECKYQEHDVCCAMGHEEQTSGNHCCHVEYKILKIDLEAVSQKISFNDYSKFITLLSMILPVAITAPEYHSVWERCQAPLLLQFGKSSLIYRYAQLRL